MSIHPIWIQELREVLGDERRVSTSPSLRQHHGQDRSYHRSPLPDAVVFPQSTAEVSAVLRWAYQRGVPVVPYGAGSSLEGHILPVRGGISLDMTQMDQILEISPGDLLARVQAGVTRSQLNRRLAGEGLFFPVDPGADATIGGMAATNASGTNAVRYGAMKHQVLGLEVVLADGRVIRTGGRAVKSSAGYNLTALFVGSEGTLGVITEVTVRVYPLPEVVLAARLTFASVEQAVDFAVTLIRSGIQPGRLELVDPLTLRAVNAYKGTAYPEKPTLFLELAGTQTAVQDAWEQVRQLAALETGVQLAFETDPGSRERLWEARHQAAFAIAATAPGKRMVTTDVCVPLSCLAEAVHHARQVAAAHGVEAAILGHVGDGNYHVTFMVDPDDPSDRQRAERVNEAIVQFALARGGTCTGEHGVGLGKKKFLLAEHPTAVPVMRVLKAALDPRHILNPGKVIDEGVPAAGNRGADR